MNAPSAPNPRPANSAPWTIADLEAFHDGALSNEQAARLADDLRHDPRLRERLASVVRVDATVRSALLVAPRAAAPGRAARSLWPVWSAVAAAVLVVVGALIVAFGARPSVPASPLASVMPPAPVARPEVAPPVDGPRMVLSIPIRRSLLVSTSAPGLQFETPGPDPLGTALSKADIPGAIALLDKASEDERVAAYRRFAELILSAEAAQRTLAMLPAEQQVEACRLWTKESRLRPATFAHLRTLKDDAQLSARVAEVVRDLERDPVLQPWLRSYGLSDGRPTSPHG